jgi:hypothetical protein
MMLVKHAASAGGGILEHFEESCHPVFRAERLRKETPLVGWVELLRNPSTDRADGTSDDGFRIAREDGRKRPCELNPSYTC